MIISKKNKKIISIISIIILLFLIIIAGISLYKDKQEKKQLEQHKEEVMKYTSLEDFKDMQDVALYLDFNLIKVQESKQENIKYVVKVELAVKPEQQSASSYYEKLVQYFAFVLKYENFYIVDDENNIEILVLCNKESELISNYYINGEENYFKIKEVQEEINNSEKIESINVDIQSELLNQIINNDWRMKSDFGTIETTFNNYDVYFDEGFQIRKVNNKVLNIIFNEEYTENIINSININSTNDEIIEALGEPQFKMSEFIGYKAKNMYIFFFENQISIYRLEEYDTDDILEYIEQFYEDKNLEKLITQVKNAWKDYDIFEYGSNYIKLQYTNKGISFEYGTSSNNGIYVYNNYNGWVSKDKTMEQIIKNKEKLPQNVFYQDIDLVYKQELERINTQYDYSSNGNLPNSVIGNTSSKFKIVKKEINDTYKILFISIGKQYPSSELKENIANGIWYNDEMFIYSVTNRGIFFYNAVERTYGTIVTGADKYNITKIEDGNLYYDDRVIKVEI